MALPIITGEFGLISDPEIKFANSGKSWAKVRGVAKDRVKDSNGQWSDGDPTYLDIVCFGKEAENLVESAAKGDTIIISGKFQQKEWTGEDGVKKNSYRVVADTIGVSLKWTPAKTPRVLGDHQPGNAKSNIANAVQELTSSQPDEAPF